MRNEKRRNFKKAEEPGVAVLFSEYTFVQRKKGFIKLFN
ncbi:hypothetical protein M132_1707 [Bacteroides fragilis str. S24L15]|nr:hypothetical protein M115_1762 [Bacteroides fragilis str. 3719 T6]EYA71584.1 hypothetical protein M132_1707 [Bacteroides fragilis str. S24L15]EYA75961.1 hypothetical protein M133_1717 [Bacteroides fragilis str. S24L26]EYA80601.1 hypothetical protein M134_1845 [Bacteroides fragilis str. S24L34]